SRGRKRPQSSQRGKLLAISSPPILERGTQLKESSAERRAPDEKEQKRSSS
ncbi:hypothetical protein IscW_ISCW019997, partial [Ixodes scapularis]